MNIKYITSYSSGYKNKSLYEAPSVLTMYIHLKLPKIIQLFEYLIILGA